MRMTILNVALLCLACGWCDAQSAAPAALLPGAPSVAEYPIEDLHLVGAAVTMPLISDTVLGVESRFRGRLFSEGILLRANGIPGGSVNLLEGPAPANQQIYFSQRPTWITGVSLILTADLSREHQVEIKAGYIASDVDFMGMQVGGAIAAGAQGVYAVLPFQVGLSYLPLTAPSLNVRILGPRFTYGKAGVLRSLDATGGPDTEQRNQSEFRFVPKGDRHALYTKKLNGKKESGTECVYFFMNYQVRESPSQRACHGFYASGVVMTAVSGFNAYDRYYEARLYQKAPFRSHPDDVLSFVAAYLGRSKYVTESLAAQGKPVWHSSPSMTASYSVHVSRANYLTIGLGYVRGAAITPRVADTLTFTTTWGLSL